MRTKLWILYLVAVLAGSFYSIVIVKAQNNPTATPEPTPAMSGMSNMESEFSTDDFAPLVHGIYEGEDVYFIHTETSDPEIASLLTDMMGPQVILVPSLVEMPEELLGNVYAFTNGISDAGPLGFQADIFDSVPGDENYTPLRALNTVTWQDDSIPRILNSVAELEAAEYRRGDCY